MIPALTPLARFHAIVGVPIIIDAGTPGRRFIPILGGTVEGGLAGRILPGGDWQIVEPDGTLDIDARYILDIADHGTVEVRSQGLRSGPPDVLAALARREAVPATAYYFRTALRFHTAAPGLRRLNHLLAVAVGARGTETVDLDVFELG